MVTQHNPGYITALSVFTLPSFPHLHPPLDLTSLSFIYFLISLSTSQKCLLISFSILLLPASAGVIIRGNQSSDYSWHQILLHKTMRVWLTPPKRPCLFANTHFKLRGDVKILLGSFQSWLCLEGKPQDFTDLCCEFDNEREENMTSCNVNVLPSAVKDRNTGKCEKNTVVKGILHWFYNQFQSTPDEECNTAFDTVVYCLQWLWRKMSSSG